MILETYKELSIKVKKWRKKNDANSKTKDNILAKYAVETSKELIGISEYELNALIKDFKEGDITYNRRIVAGIE